MTLKELKAIPDLQGRLQQAIISEYGMSLPVGDLVRRAALKPELLQLDEYEKPLYALCFLYQEPFVKEILEEINHDYDTKESVRKYIVEYFQAQGASTNEEIKERMQQAVQALPTALQSEPTCNNFKICKYIELSETEYGRTANITDALFENKKAVASYGGEMEVLIEQGTPIEVANRIASSNTAKKFNLSSVLAAPVKMKYKIRDSVEESIAEGLGEHKYEYLARQDAIRAEKVKYLEAKIAAKSEKKINNLRQNVIVGDNNSKSNMGFGSMRNGNIMNTYSGRNQYNQPYNGYNSDYRNQVSTDNVMLWALLAALIITAVSILIAYIKHVIFSSGSIVGIIGCILTVIAEVKKHSGEKGYMPLSIIGLAVTIFSLYLNLKERMPIY